MKHQRTFSKTYLFLMAAAMMFTVSCQLDVPMQEMVTAKASIESAKAVDAEKYSPEEIKKAEELLLQSQNLLTDEKAKDAKKAAEDSITAALAAEKKALPFYADDHIKKAEAEYAEADKAYAERFSPEKFAKSGELTAEAKQNLEKGEFRKSATLADQAYVLAVEAKDESLQNSSSIESQVQSLEARYEKLKRDQYSGAAEENLTKAGTAISSAKQGVANKEYKTAMTDINNAGIELDAASMVIVKKGMSARIEKLRGDLNSINKPAQSDDVKADLDKALLALNAAESSLEQNYIEDAEMRIKEADALINGADTKLKEKSALAAIAKAEKLLGQAKEKDTAGKHAENLGKAENLIAEGKTNVANGKFNEGTGNAEEAETIIAAVLNSMETEANDLKLKASVEEHKEEGAKEETAVKEEVKKEEKPAGKIYVVQWRKKNTDCLWRISQKVYKDAALWPAIYIANRDQIKDPDLIFPGQKFVIPPKPKKRISYKQIVEEEKAKEKAAEQEKLKEKEKEDKEKESGKAKDTESKEPSGNK